MIHRPNRDNGDWWEMETAGDTRRLFVQINRFKAACGEITDGVVFQRGNCGPWAVSLTELEELVQKVKAARA
jgi:hypothetical protein